MMALAQDIAEIYDARGRQRYGLEHISQLQHALQTATFLEQQGATPALILAGLLHDVGHMIHKLGENPAGEGIDDRHELLGAKWLAKRFPASVAEPVRLHVEAKRYLCGTDPDYASRLAPDSVLSLTLQGGPMGPVEAAAFLKKPFASDAVLLRRLDDEAKDPEAATPPLSHFLSLLPLLAIDEEARDHFAREGVLVLRDFFSPNEVVRLQAYSHDMGQHAQSLLLRGPEAEPSCDDLIAVAEASNPKLLCRFEYLLGANRSFSDFVMGRIAPAISCLTGEAFVPFKDKENEKLPGGGAFGPHQDFAAYQSFGPRYNVTAMISIDAATTLNGCLEFASNWQDFADSHFDAVEERIEGRPLLRFEKGGAKNGDIERSIAGALDWRSIETKPGDLVLFHSFAPHRSSINESTSARRAMFVTFNAAREGDWYARYYAEKRAHADDPKFHISTPTRHAGAVVEERN